MKRVWNRMLFGLALGGFAAVVSPGCAHDDSTLFVYDVLAPPVGAPGAVCTFTSDPTQPFISSGVLDLDLAGHYDAAFLLANQLVPQGNPSAPKTETSYINIQGAVVRITNAMGTQQYKTYTHLAAATLPPASGTSPGFGPVDPVTILDSLTAQTYGPGRYITYTRFFGKTLGGQSVESNEFEFPVDVCLGCLITFSAADINPCYQAPNCAAASTSTTQMSVPCRIGQDFHVDCAACKGISSACDPMLVRVAPEGGACP